jgi:lipid II:glycine glycyltransferase (peptidoglycan interpeptide bridge formation enzyme)
VRRRRSPIRFSPFSLNLGREKTMKLVQAIGERLHASRVNVDPVQPSIRVSRLLDPLDAEAWNAFAHLQPGDTVVQTTAWVAAKRRLGFDAEHVVWRQGGDIVGGAHIIIRRFAPFGAVGYVSRGPLLKDSDESSAAQGVEVIERAARQVGVTLLIVQPAEGGEAVEAALDAQGYHGNAPEVATTATIRLDLRQGADELLARMSKSVRRHISASQRNGRVTTRLVDGADLDLFHQLHAASAERQGFTPISIDYLRAHWEALAANGWMRLLLTEIDGEPVVGKWVTAFGDSVVLRIHGWNGKAAEYYPNEATYWWVIRWARDNGFRYCDFGGISRAAGLALASDAAGAKSLLNSRDAFKYRFGGRVVLLPRPRFKVLQPLAAPLVHTALRLLDNSRWAPRLMAMLRAG